mmetsp:Transcript_60869/g.83585  ORF Transcript_60869/g.83585 Transcript_60869/m.83585 type:complete len:222 (-) Transcript_60869:102-767(-)
MRLLSVMLLCCTDLRTSLAFRLGGSPSVRTFTYFPVVRRRPTKGIATMTRSTQSSVTRVVFKLNASTKWLVTAAVTTTVLMRRDFIAPYTAVGGIVATFGTDLLKKAINQDRPAGAPFTDPGMPSSHALVSTFLAVGWTMTLGLTPVSGVILACALAVSLLRVACGYHSWAQVRSSSVESSVLPLLLHGCPSVTSYSPGLIRAWQRPLYGLRIWRLLLLSS